MNDEIQVDDWNIGLVLSEEAHEQMSYDQFLEKADVSAVYDTEHFMITLSEEEDGSVTLSLVEIDLVENAGTEEEARNLLAEAIVDYSIEYYGNYQIYSKAPNRRSHIPYIFKALIMDDTKKLGENIICLDGKNK